LRPTLLEHPSINTDIEYPHPLCRRSRNSWYFLIIRVFLEFILLLFQPILPITGVHFLDQADITAPKTHQNILRLLNGRTVDVVLSDMAPNPTGDGGLDHERIVSLCSTLLELSVQKSVIPLVRNGTFLCKIFDGPRRNELIAQLQQHFAKVYTVKPKASRDHSAEVYLLALRKRD
uniref:rRNA methyltransferase 2, mitochondrial n=1 Tax=Gongylonema pulchrum TaxID=637853 RepID=A0A183EXL9_9BILA